MTSDGLPPRKIIAPASSSAFDGPIDAVPILLLHGASVSRDTWDETKQQLMDRYCVWTLDFRGHGHSDRAPNYNLAGYVSDAETALAAIGRPAIVVGHSLGACVAGVSAKPIRTSGQCFLRTRRGS